MLGERPTLELALGTKRGPEGLSIEQGSPAEGNRVKLIEVLLELLSLELLSHRVIVPNKSVQPQSSTEGQECTRRRQAPIRVCHMTRVSPLCRKNFQIIKPGKCGR